MPKKVRIDRGHGEADHAFNLSEININLLKQEICFVVQILNLETLSADQYIGLIDAEHYESVKAAQDVEAAVWAYIEQYKRDYVVLGHPAAVDEFVPDWVNL